MFEYKSDALPIPCLQVVFQHPALESPGKRTTTPGFSLSWFIKKAADETEGSDQLPIVSTWKLLLETKHVNLGIKWQTMLERLG